jgi:hypothetical protein
LTVRNADDLIRRFVPMNDAQASPSAIDGDPGHDLAKGQSIEASGVGSPSPMRHQV